MSLLTTDDLDFDFSTLKLNKNEELQMLGRMMLYSAGMRQWMLRMNNVSGRTKINNDFKLTGLFRRMNEIQKQTGKPIQDCAAQAEQEAKDRRNDAIMRASKSLNVYQYMSEVFKEAPDFVLKSIQRVTGILPDGINIRLTSNPNWL
ncbi:MAG: hypothetical protein JSV32_05005 [Dehalococcoidia bacterium]|nr:MAG: hypothetical protein JSV32_05005 [Dehalococcoidia bacterium]